MRSTIRIKRFGLFCDMMKVVQDNAGDKADRKPESRLERCFKTGCHKAIMSQPRSAACYFIEPSGAYWRQTIGENTNYFLYYTATSAIATVAPYPIYQYKLQTGGR
jgi:hypothetical protein